MRTCSKCRQTKPFESFYKNRSMPGGLSWWCKSCFDVQRGIKRKLAKKIDGLGFCYNCNEYKPEDCFYRFRPATCKSCIYGKLREYRAANPEKVKEWYTKTHEKRKGMEYVYRLLRIYGLTVSDYNLMVERQGGACAICRIETEKLTVDHNHETGAVRKLLCGFCNSGIGYFRESPTALRAAAQYVEDHQENFIPEA